MPKVTWAIEFYPACETWADDLDQADAEALLAAIRILRDEGPNLGRPLVDTIKGSRHKNMKELRPGSTGRTEVRVLFAFDTARKAILLVGGDKSDDWRGWYRSNIPIADDRFDGHQASIKRRAKGQAITMSLKKWENKVLGEPGAPARVTTIEEELRLAAGLTALREAAGLSQRELAQRIGVSQPRIAAIERSRNVTVDVLDHYVNALGGTLEVNVLQGNRKISLVGGSPSKSRTSASTRPAPA